MIKVRLFWNGENLLVNNLKIYLYMIKHVDKFWHVEICYKLLNIYLYMVNTMQLRLMSLVYIFIIRESRFCDTDAKLR